MLFIDRPITLQHVRDFCARFNEGIRVEYKSNFDQNVRNDLPKVISSFANSQGGVIVAGINTQRGVPQPPFEGFAEPRRDELSLTIENICLRNIHPPVLPRTTVVPSDVPNQIFLIMEVEESGEAPHTIENSKKVYVRTGNAASPYDLADVDSIIDLMKRRKEPLERLERLVELAEKRADQTVEVGLPYAQITVCPNYPRNALCSTEEVWDILLATRYRGRSLIPIDSMRRVPDGVAGLTPAHLPQISAQYDEVNKYGLLFVRSQIRQVPWLVNGARFEVLYFGDVLQPFLKFLVCAERFYGATGYRGNLQLGVTLHNVRDHVMPSFDPGFDLTPDDFRCFADVVSAARLTDVDQVAAQRLDVLVETLSEVCWAFWQANQNFPADRLRANAAQIIAAM